MVVANEHGNEIFGFSSVSHNRLDKLTETRTENRQENINTLKSWCLRRWQIHFDFLSETKREREKQRESFSTFRCYTVQQLYGECIYIYFVTTSRSFTLSHSRTRWSISHRFAPAIYIYIYTYKLSVHCQYLIPFPFFRFLPDLCMCLHSLNRQYLQ